jgi:hypothetical protein
MTATAIDKSGKCARVCSYILDPSLSSQFACFGGASEAAHFRPTSLIVVSGCSATEVGKGALHSPLSPAECFR